MLRFQYMSFFWLLLVPLVLGGIYLIYLSYRKRQIKKFGDIQRVESLMPGHSLWRKGIRFTLVMMALAAIGVGLANLQAGKRSEKVSRKGIDVMIALDVSKSMLAKDVSPNRLEKARLLIYRLLEKLGNDRVGLVLFAGRAYVSVPLTVDFSALKMNLSTASPDLVPTQGTVLGEAIDMSRQCFNAKETKYKSIVLISDGEDHDEGVSDAVKQAVSEGIMINTVGIGSPEGSPIWDEETHQNKVDAEGKDVISKLNEEILSDIASKAQGIYQRLQNAEQVANTLGTQISSTEQKNFGDSIFTDYDSYYQYFLGFSLLLLLIEPMIPEKKPLR